jgi:hypothetical protein
MGCILSHFKKEDLSESFLVTTPCCFVCGTVFPNMTEYNKHIVHCNLLYQKTTQSFKN